MKKVFILVFIFILAIGVVILNLDKNEGNNLDYNNIYKYKTKYVGDASKVSNLVNNLNYGEFKTKISLNTQNRPYVVNIHYSRIPKNLSQEDTKTITANIFKNASIMFCLIENLDEVNFIFEEQYTVETFSFDRESINKVFNEDIRNYSTSLDKFESEFLKLIERHMYNTSNI
ncbi:DUF4825 domain-containing protein [Alkalithermobacter paradoxus]|uniref:DUF4825 domain-containing protein n=1 Tax=Alkalithermobacter paradoxus TaxID=29349 RepID=A0A1V4I7G1_9FIRM|nr:hypothetical protein CLOTH_10120 [[Clostridium] thermoalcaliphilum]